MQQTDSLTEGQEKEDKNQGTWSSSDRDTPRGTEQAHIRWLGYLSFEPVERPWTCVESHEQ